MGTAAGQDNTIAPPVLARRTLHGALDVHARQLPGPHPPTPRDHRPAGLDSFPAAAPDPTSRRCAGRGRRPDRLDTVSHIQPCNLHLAGAHRQGLAGPAGRVADHLVHGLLQRLPAALWVQHRHDAVGDGVRVPAGLAHRRLGHRGGVDLRLHRKQGRLEQICA